MWGLVFVGFDFLTYWGGRRAIYKTGDVLTGPQRVIGTVGYMLQHSLVQWPAGVQPGDPAWRFPSHPFNQSLSKKIKAAEQKEDWRASTRFSVTLSGTEWEQGA